MHIRLPQDPIQAKGMVASIHHKGFVLDWDISSFPFRSFRSTVLSHHINEYWRSLPDRTQDEIFSVYKKIKDVFNSASDVFSASEFSANALISELQEPCMRLMELHPFDSVLAWSVGRQDIVIPASMKTSFDAEIEWMQTAAKTYTMYDYSQLCALVITLRCIIPVWGEFQYRTSTEIGNQFKDYYTLALIGQSVVMSCPAMEKLIQYIEHNMPNEKQNPAAILRQASSEEYTTMVLATLLVRKVCMGDVSTVIDNTNLVTVIYNAIGQRAGTNNGALFNNTNIRMKEFPDGDGDNPSRIEHMRAQYEEGVGVISVANVYASRPYDMLEKIDPTCPAQLLSDFLGFNGSLIDSSHSIQDVQILVTQYVIHKAMSGRCIPHLNKANVINCVSVAQALLWHWSFKKIAAMLSASPPKGASMSAGITEPRYRIPPALITELERIYPYGQTAPVRKKQERESFVMAGVKTPKTNLPVLEDIAVVVDGFSKNDWILNLPKDYWELITGRPEQRRLTCPADIRVQMAQLAIKLNS